MNPFTRRPPVIDMTPDGQFRELGLPRGTWVDRTLARVGGVAILLAVVAGGLVIAALAFALVGLLLPVLLGASVVGAAALWWRARRLRAGGAPFVAGRR